MLLCDALKLNFARVGIDDCESDPYKIVFDRVLSYHQTHAPKGLRLIKNVIFFRLCGYPRVRAPESGSPKKQLIDRYIRTWNLSASQVKKLMSFPDWPEKEKQLLDTTLIQRLATVYEQIRAKGEAIDRKRPPAEQRVMAILNHKVRERLNKDGGKIPGCSNFLTRLAFPTLLIQEKPVGKWVLSAPFSPELREGVLYRSHSFLGVMGWIMENRLYQRGQHPYPAGNRVSAL